MFLPDKKKAVSVILSRMNGGKSKDLEKKPEESIDSGIKDDAFTTFAEDMMQAFQDKSVMGLAEVLESFFQYVQSKDVEQDEQEG